MTDRMTPEQRHNCMAAIRGKNTRPEIMVRSFLHANGLRFRIHVKNLPGTPDVVLPKYKTVIFINGCFWHGHQGCRQGHMPSTNTGFWSQKIMRNRRRDAANFQALNAMGWKVIHLWTCQLGSKVRQATLSALLDAIRRPQELPRDEEELLLAAEPQESYGI